MSNPIPLPTPRRWWPRFTLRMLLALITLLAISLGWWTHRAREQRRVVEMIEASGGMACYESDGPAPAYEPGSFKGWLVEKMGRDYFEEIVAAYLHDRKLLRNLAIFPGLRQLHVYDPHLKDEDLAVVGRCRELRVLYVSEGEFGGDVVSNTQLGDKSLHVIAKLDKLEVVELHGIDFSRAGIEALATAPSLRTLVIGLCDASVEARDFDKLKRLGRIKSLQAWRATDSPSGVEEIARW
ncbi:MAG: hypothetical protein SFU86_21960 [Pirellulaceae bacterium]|nr:hypothetical protein [Pirellulaceae bacterium]